MDPTLLAGTLILAVTGVPTTLWALKPTVTNITKKLAKPHRTGTPK